MADVKWSNNAAFPPQTHIDATDTVVGLKSGGNAKFTSAIMQTTGAVVSGDIPVYGADGTNAKSSGTNIDINKDATGFKSVAVTQDATSALQLTTKQQMDAGLALKLSLTGGTMSGAINMGVTNKITNLANPTVAQDAATKAYVDSSPGGDVVGPASSTTNAVARYSNTSGKLIKDSVNFTATDAGVVSMTGLIAGTSNTNTGNNNVISGVSSSVVGNNSVAMGDSCSVTGDASWAIGSNANAVSSNQMIAVFSTGIEFHSSTTTGYFVVPGALNAADGALLNNDISPAVASSTSINFKFRDNLGTIRNILLTSGGASGDVVGPASATDKALASYDGTTGKLIQNTTVIHNSGTTGGLWVNNPVGPTTAYHFAKNAGFNGGMVWDASIGPAAASLADGEMTAVGQTNQITINWKSGGTPYTLVLTPGGGLGDVVGPASATDNAVCRFDSTTGKLIQNSVFLVGDTGIATGGTWQGTVIGSTYGGTGVNNGSSTITLAGNLVTSGANSLTLTTTGSTSVTLPTSGTLVNTAVTTLSSLASIGTITTGVWNGSVIGLAFGGTNANLTASNGGIFYSTATAGAILAGTATAGQMLRSGSSAAPTWSTATWPATTTANRILYSSAANTVSEITSANSAMLVTNSSGVPSFTSTMTDGQVVIGFTGSTPVNSTLSAGSGVSIVNAAGSITISATGGGMSTVEVTGTSVSLAVNTRYVLNNAGLVTATLPSTFALGDTFEVVGKGAGGWKVAQASGQTIHSSFGSTTTGTGGSLSSTNQYDRLILTGITANTDLSANPTGSLTIV